MRTTEEEIKRPERELKRDAEREKEGGAEKASMLTVAAAFSLLCTYKIIKLRMANES